MIKNTRICQNYIYIKKYVLKFIYYHKYDIIQKKYKYIIHRTHVIKDILD